MHDQPPLSRNRSPNAIQVLRRKTLSPEVVGWIESVTGQTLCGCRMPSTPAGQNSVWLLSFMDGSEAILRLSAPHRHEHAISGIRIRALLANSGLPVPQSLGSHAGIEVDGHILFAELMERMPGRDLSIMACEASPQQLSNIASDVALFAWRSSEVFEDEEMLISHAQDPLPVSGFGLHRMGTVGPKASWLQWCHSWLSWAGNQAVALELITAEELDELHSALWTMQDSLDDITRRTFVWDVGARNVMISRGRMIGIVDQDVLLSGDLLVVPALARVALEIGGHALAKQYSEFILLAWPTQAMGDARTWRSRLNLYQMLYALQFASKRLPDGRKNAEADLGIFNQHRRAWLQSLGG